AVGSLSVTTAPPFAVHTVSLHDALPILGEPAVPGRTARSISLLGRTFPRAREPKRYTASIHGCAVDRGGVPLRLTGTRERPPQRSEEHTSELQSRENLVCRLLLEKKKKH